SKVVLSNVPLKQSDHPHPCAASMSLLCNRQASTPCRPALPTFQRSRSSFHLRTNALRARACRCSTTQTKVSNRHHRLIDVPASLVCHCYIASVKPWRSPNAFDCPFDTFPRLSRASERVDVGCRLHSLRHCCSDRARG